MFVVAKSLSRAEEGITLEVFQVSVRGLLAGDCYLKLIILLK